MRYVEIFGLQSREANHYRSLAKLNGYKVANTWADSVLGGRNYNPRHVPALVLTVGWEAVDDEGFYANELPVNAVVIWERQAQLPEQGYSMRPVASWVEGK